MATCSRTRRHQTIRATLCGITIALAATTAAGCNGYFTPPDKIGNFTSADQPGGCDVNVQNIHPSGGEKRKGNPKSLTGKATLTCSVDVTDARLDMQIEKSLDGDWKTVATNSGKTDDKNPAIGSLRANESVIRQVDYPCEDGAYRLGAKASAVMDGTPSKMNDWKYGNESTIQC